jgi:hypothetical protein
LRILTSAALLSESSGIFNILWIPGYFFLVGVLSGTIERSESGSTAAGFWRMPILTGVSGPIATIAVQAI